MDYFVYENRIIDKAIIHRGDCSFCKNGKGIHGRNTTNSSTWHGPFDTAGEALAKAKSWKRDRTDFCSRCSPTQPVPPARPSRSRFTAMK
jgi:hypothetical protein